MSRTALILAALVFVGWLLGGEDDRPEQIRVEAGTTPIASLSSDAMPEDVAALYPQAPGGTGATPVPARDGRPVFVTGSFVNTRSGPGTEFAKLGGFQRETELFATGRTSDRWLEIQDRASGLVGWMHGDYLSSSRPVRPEPAVRQAALPPQRSDAEARQRIIRDSIARYSGSCPCPYNTDRAGRRCGGRSAYSRPGGRAPLCYPEDVSAAMVAASRQ